MFVSIFAAKIITFDSNWCGINDYIFILCTALDEGDIELLKTYVSWSLFWLDWHWNNLRCWTFFRGKDNIIRASKQLKKTSRKPSNKSMNWRESKRAIQVWRRQLSGIWPLTNKLSQMSSHCRYTKLTTFIIHHMFGILYISDHLNSKTVIRSIKYRWTFANITKTIGNIFIFI